MENSLQVSLILHIIGLSTVFGVTLVRYILSRKFWVQYKKDKEKGLTILQASSKLPLIAGIGLVLLILSGFMMMAITAGVFGHQLWFRIKMIVVILIIAVSVFLSKGLENRLRKWVTEDMIEGSSTHPIGNLIGRINTVQLFLSSLFILIFILSVFKFN